MEAGTIGHNPRGFLKSSWRSAWEGQGLSHSGSGGISFDAWIWATAAGPVQLTILVEKKKSNLELSNEANGVSSL